MKKLFFISLLLGICNFADAQFLFDYHLHYDSISKLSSLKKSDWNYNELLKRFQADDSTLTRDDALALMIGETQQENYYPYELVQIETEILKAVQFNQMDVVLSKCDSVLENHHLNFIALMERAYALSVLKKPEEHSAKSKMILVLDAVLSSGEGTFEHPIFVLGPMDGQILIRFIFGKQIGVMGSGEDAAGYFLDILEIVDPEQETFKMYFNIDHAFKRMFRKETLKKFEKVSKKEEKRP